MKTAESKLEDLPKNILDKILSFVPCVDVVSICKVSKKLRQAAYRSIHQRERLEFTGCYHLNDDDARSLLTILHYKHNIRHLNLDHCYWLQPTTLEAFLSSMNHLRECHLIDCNVSNESIEAVLSLKLTSLSLSWSDKWYFRSKYMVLLHRCDPNYTQLAFHHLKRLTIFVPPSVGPACFIDISSSILKHCHELKTLKLYDSPLENVDCRNHRHDHIHYQRFYSSCDLLPKLQSLTIDLMDEPLEGNCLTEFVLRFFQQRQTQLNEVYLGKASFSFMEREMAWSLSIVPWISTEKITSICLDDHSNFTWFNSPRKFPRVEPSIWSDRMTPNCSTVSIGHLRLLSSSMIFGTIAVMCPNLEKLSFHGSHIDIDTMFLGMSSMVEHCPRLTYLDMTVDIGDTEFDYSIQCLIDILVEFKNLKSLHLATQLLSCWRDSEDFQSETQRHSFILTDNTEANEVQMRLNPFYKLTQSCNKMETFKILSGEMDNERIVSEVLLACISNWKHLKHLHLVNIPTSGQGQFLAVITHNCKKLTTLYLKNVCCAGICNYTSSLIESLSYANQLKDLSIVQDLKFSQGLSIGLEKCDNLQRLFLQSLNIPYNLETDFVKTITEHTGLVAVVVEVAVTNEEKANEIYLQLECLKSTRPASFIILSTNICSKMSNWPVIHYELQRYRRIVRLEL